MYYYGIDYDDNSLKHYGVKGMKWGVRKSKTSSWSRQRAANKEYRNLKKSIKKRQKSEDFKNQDLTNRISEATSSRAALNIADFKRATTTKGGQNAYIVKNTIKGVNAKLNESPKQKYKQSSAYLSNAKLMKDYKKTVKDGGKFAGYYVNQTTGDLSGTAWENGTTTTYNISKKKKKG